MHETLMMLGNYRFALNTAAYQTLKHQHAFRWQTQARLQRTPATQYVGEGEQRLELEGVIYPHFQGGLKQLVAMRREAQKGEPLLLVDGLGFVWGAWAIISLTEKHTHLLGNGQSLKQHFQLTLLHYGDDR